MEKTVQSKRDILPWKELQTLGLYHDQTTYENKEEGEEEEPISRDT